MLANAAQRGPAVLAILESTRETPAEQLQAVLTLIDLGAEDIADSLWKSLGSADLDDAACVELANKIGTARLLQLARREKSLETEDDTPITQFAGARKFSDRCLKLAAEAARDPKRISMLVSALNDPSPAARRAARVDLAATGTAGAVACLEALAQAQEESVRANLMFGITTLRPEVDPLLLAALTDGRGHFRRDVTELAGHLQLKEAIPWLAAIASGAEDDPTVVSAAVTALSKLGLPLPSADEARTLLTTEIERIEAGVSDWPTDDPTHRTFWFWLPEAGPNKADSGPPGKFHPEDYDSRSRKTLAAERLARMLVSCGEPSPQERRLALIYHFEAARIRAQDKDTPIDDQLSSHEISETLAAALQGNHLQAATACTKILGDRNDPAILTSRNGRPSPLAAAAGHPDRELRFAALEAIMKLAPQTSFAGASNVPKALWEFAAGSGALQAITASPVAARASDWAAQLRSLEYDATPTTTGHRALSATFMTPRLSILLIDSDIGQPLLREVVFQLRSYYRTGHTPIAVLCSLPNLERSRRIADSDPWLFAVPRPHSAEAIASIVNRLKELDRSQASLERRTQQATQALTWIAQLLEQGHPYDELLRSSAVLHETLYIPELTAPSLRALAIVGTARSQQALVDLISHESQPIELRQQAAQAFNASVELFGKQLTLDQIRRQYDRYNASESADEQTQNVLGQVLDTLEGKSAPNTSPQAVVPELKP